MSAHVPAARHGPGRQRPSFAQRACRRATNSVANPGTRHALATQAPGGTLPSARPARSHAAQHATSRAGNVLRRSTTRSSCSNVGHQPRHQERHAARETVGQAPKLAPQLNPPYNSPGKKNPSDSSRHWFSEEVGKNCEFHNYFCRHDNCMKFCTDDPHNA